MSRSQGNSTEPTNCPRCGLAWIGTDKCDCGWRPHQYLHYLKLLLAVIVVTAACAGVYLVQNLRDLFPDEQAAQQRVATAEDELHRENVGKAIFHLKEAVAYSPKNAEIRRKLALALLLEKRPNEAQAEMAKAYHLHPSDKKIGRDYAVVLEQNGQEEEAARVLELAIKDDPRDSPERFRLAHMYEQCGQEAKAKAIYTEYTKVKPGVNGPWLALSRLQAHEGDRKAAIATLRAGLKHLPDDAPLRQQLGITLGDDDQIDAAVKELVASAQMDSGLAEYNSGVIATLTRGRKQEQYIIPLHRIGNSYFVEAVLNERSRARFVVDSGADTVAISQSVARDLKLAPSSGAPVMIRGVGVVAITREFVLQSVRVGPVKEQLVTATVIPDDPASDGLLGMSFLSRYEFSIDGKRNLLVLRPR